METRWPVLRYCENHWKAQRIAIDNYPQWYKTYSRKKLGEEEKTSDEPAQKKRRTMIEDDENTQLRSESETNARGGSMSEGVDENMDEYLDSNTSTPFPVGQDDQEVPRGGSSRPRARPLTRTDPL